MWDDKADSPKFGTILVPDTALRPVTLGFGGEAGTAHLAQPLP